MTKVAILPVSTDSGDISYNAVSGDKKTSGKTAGEALDALTSQLSDDDESTLVVIQRRRPDRFFGADEQKRLQELMHRWRVARDKGNDLSKEEQIELEKLVELELQASTNRAAAIIDELNQ